MSFLEIASNLSQVTMDVRLRFKLLTKSAELLTDKDKIYEATVVRISAEGLQITVPKDLEIFKLVQHMFDNKILFGINIFIPSEMEPLKVLGRLSCVDASDDSKPRYTLGLVYKNIDPDVKEKIFKFTIRAQMRKG